MRAVASIKSIRREPRHTPVPRNDQVVVKPHPKAEEISEGGIVLPNSEKTHNSMIWAEVIAVGPGGITSDGTRVPIDVRPGDTVGIAPGSGTLFTLAGVQYASIPDGGIVVVLAERTDEAVQ